MIAFIEKIDVIIGMVLNMPAYEFIGLILGMTWIFGAIFIMLHLTSVSLKGIIEILKERIRNREEPEHGQS